VTRRARNSEPGTQHRRTRTRNPKPETGNRRGLRLLHWLLLFVASLIVVDGLVGDRGLLAILRARHEYDELANTIARQRWENARLRDEAHRLKDDPSAIEEVARRELGLIKPGERVFIIKDIPPAKQ
jgi:cell division protein FtsB